MEAAARALVWEQFQGCVSWEDADHESRSYARVHARAALRAALPLLKEANQPSVLSDGPGEDHECPVCGAFPGFSCMPVRRELGPVRSSPRKSAERMNHQPLDALAVANEARLAAVAVRRAVTSGDLGLADALTHPDAQRMTVVRLLTAQRGWGPRRTRKCLAAVGVSESRRVGELTARQRKLLSVAARPGRKAAA